jgi:hypothetical protein
MSKQFDAAVLEIYRRAKSEAGYNATIFLRMLGDRGGNQELQVSFGEVIDGFS